MSPGTQSTPAKVGSPGLAGSQALRSRAGARVCDKMNNCLELDILFQGCLNLGDTYSHEVVEAIPFLAFKVHLAALIGQGDPENHRLL